MEGLTPASRDSLPPLGELIADEPFWRYRTGTAGEGVAHLRVWLMAGPEPGHLAVVTETGAAAEVTESAGHIWAELADRYGPSLVLLEHHLAPELSEGTETLDLVRVGADGSAHWLRVWPTPEENPRHAGLELWMAVHEVPGRRPARELVRLVPGRGRLTPRRPLHLPALAPVPARSTWASCCRRWPEPWLLSGSAR